MSTPDLKPMQRLLDSPDLSAELRADLSAARSFEVPFDATAGLARFQAHLDALPSGTGHVPPPPTAAAGAAPSAALQLTGGKIIAALALAAGLGWGALELTGGVDKKPAPSEQGEAARAKAETTLTANGGSAKPPAPAAQNPAPAPGPAPQVVAPLAFEGAAKPAQPSLGASKNNAARAAASPLAAPTPVGADANVAAPSVSETVAAPSAADRLAKEVAQLGEVKQALRKDPARALSLAEAGHQEFADGALRQEREALALSALEKLGQKDALNTRGAAFLKRYPQSSFAPQVERMLGH